MIPSTCVNPTPRAPRCGIRMHEWQLEGRNPSQSRVRLADMNGSGTRDVVWGDGLDYKYIDLAGGKRPWVLTHVSNGLRKTTEIEYASSPDLMLAAAAANNAWASVTPMPLHVVTKTIERDNLAIVGRPAGEYVTTYEYRDPVYDGRQREFRGFKDVKVRRVGDDNSPSATTRSLFLLGECVPEKGGKECEPENRWMDNPREALKGLPAVSESFDDKGTYLSTSHHQYRLRKLYTGLDGRAVRHAYEAQTESYSYDTAPFSGAGASMATLPDVMIQDAEAMPDAEPAYQRAVKVQSGKVAIVKSQSEVDLFGNAIMKVAYGCAEGCTPVDETITSYTAPGRPAGDPTGWLWRTTDSYTVGSAHPEAHKKTHIDYDSLGQPTDTSVELHGSVGLKRSSGGAPSPADASSVEGFIPVSHQAYDTYGNVVAQYGANGRCRSMAYEAVFNDLVVTENVFVGAATGGGPGTFACGSVPLTSTAEYDRGSGAVTSVFDIHGEKTATEYDGFGRLVSLNKPDPVAIGAVSLVPSVLIEYKLTTDAVGHPFSVLHTRTQDGATPDDASYLESWAYVDGMGRTLVTLQEADPDAQQDGHQWVVNGLTEYDNKGAARRAYLAWFWDGDGDNYPLSKPVATPYGRQRYDAFGRQIETFGLDGTITLKSAYHALSKDMWDAADLAPGPHQGTYASERMDGHGRSVATTERVHAAGKIEARETQRTYLPTGPVETITRVAPAGAVQRWMRYDSLDRMVLNVEPSTTKGGPVAFSADPSGDDAIIALRYAYNDAGDLVGTSDARGCGSNFHYDAAGRLLAEDYSPCLPTHPAYTSPSLITGVGAEVFYRYDHVDPDSPAELGINDGLLLGRLASVTDRASKTVSSFDARGRVIGVGRKVAAPKDPSSADDSERFNTRWYTSTTTYDGADRPVDDSTGAVSTDLQGNDGKSVVHTTYSGRGTVKQIGGSYDLLVGRVTHDADGLVGLIEYGDLAKTTTAYTYDNRRRVQSVQTYRGPPPAWADSPNSDSQQTLLEDLDYSYDAVDNPTEIRDWRIESEWPDGAKPVSRKMEYDDLYRVTKVDYTYAQGADPWTDPFKAETLDPSRTQPSPHVTFEKRVQQQSFTYDWLGNTTHTGDDANV
jgi:YD repeat-containing protein